MDWLATYQHADSHLPGHPVKHKTPGIELNTGALGHGLPVAVGIALAAKRSNSKRRVFVVTGDGELAEGSNWEAALVAAHYKLDNLIIINDKNNLQLAGSTKEIMNTDPLDEKWRAFGMQVTECRGNDMSDVVRTLEGLTPDVGSVGAGCGQRATTGRGIQADLAGQQGGATAPPADRPPAGRAGASSTSRNAAAPWS